MTALLLLLVLMSVASAPAFVLPGSTYVWAVQTVDRGLAVGGSTSLALDSSGSPHIAYLNPEADLVLYTAWTGATWKTEVVDTEGEFFGDVSLALDSEDRPHLGYYRGEGGFQMHAVWDEAAWEIQRIERGLRDGFNSLALDSAGRPHLAYPFLNGRLRHAAWNGTGWAIETVDPQVVTPRYMSLALDSADRPHVAYYGFRNLYYAVRNETAWSAEVVDARRDVGRFARLALDSQDRPHIGYRDADARLLRYTVKAGNRWHMEAVDYQGDTGWDLDLQVDDSDRVHFTYYERTEGELRYTLRTELGWIPQVADSDGIVGWFTSLAIDLQGLPHVSYYNWTGSTLKYARASLGPVIRTLGPSIVTATNSTLRGDVVSLGDFAEVNVTFEWRPSGSPAWGTTPPKAVSTEGVVEAPLTNLTPAQDFEYRARATVEGKTVYGDVISFRTLPSLDQDGWPLAGLEIYLLIGGVAVALLSWMVLILFRRRRKLAPDRDSEAD